jgi:hypothetical protein
LKITDATIALTVILVVSLAGLLLLLWKKVCMSHEHGHNDEHEEIRLLREAVGLLQEIFQTALAILQAVRPPVPKLSKVKLSFGGIMPLGPVTLNVGQSTTASLKGFDQNGQPMPADFVMPPVTYAVDNPAIASSTPNADNTDQVTGVSTGVANLTGSVTSAEGLALSDTETVTVPVVPPPTPVLSSVKIDFSTPTP